MIAYLDCFSGAAGDMILGALIDAGADAERIAKQLRDIAGIELRTESVHRSGIRATKVHIAGEVSVATPSDAMAMIEKGNLEASTAARAVRIFERLARAEAVVHGIDVSEVHFHEIDGADTIGDIVGVCIALDMLEISHVHSSSVATGTGTVKTAHGVLPVPPPAVTELLKGAPMYGRPIEMETVTPTGAAILAEIVEGWGPMPAMTIAAVGYGAGSKEIEGVPNVVRVLIGEPLASTDAGAEEIIVEANIDDMNPELFEWVSERLFAAGAVDVWTTQIIGKKGRPAAIVSALAPKHLEQDLRRTLVTETSTIGVRTSRVSRWMLERRWVEVKVAGRPVRVKVAYERGVPVNASPEYADCAEVARQSGLPLKEVFRRASAQIGPMSEGAEPTGMGGDQ